MFLGSIEVIIFKFFDYYYVFKFFRLIYVFFVFVFCFYFFSFSVVLRSIKIRRILDFMFSSVEFGLVFIEVYFVDIDRDIDGKRSLWLNIGGGC